MIGTLGDSSDALVLICVRYKSLHYKWSCGIATACGFDWICLSHSEQFLY